MDIIIVPNIDYFTHMDLIQVPTQDFSDRLFTHEKTKDIPNLISGGT